MFVGLDRLVVREHQHAASGDGTGSDLAARGEASKPLQGADSLDHHVSSACPGMHQRCEEALVTLLQQTATILPQHTLLIVILSISYGMSPPAGHIETISWQAENTGNPAWQCLEAGQRLVERRHKECIGLRIEPHEHASAPRWSRGAQGTLCNQHGGLRQG